MLVLFLILLIAPLIARNQNILKNFKNFPMQLLQPLDAENNDTITGYTGSGLPPGMQAIPSESWGVATAR